MQRVAVLPRCPRQCFGLRVLAGLPREAIKLINCPSSSTTPAADDLALRYFPSASLKARRKEEVKHQLSQLTPRFHSNGSITERTHEPKTWANQN